MPDAEYTKGSIPKILLKTGSAMIIATLAMSGYNIADTYFVGQLSGAEPLAAMGFTFPVVMIVGCIFGGLGSGIMTPLAHALGASDQRKATRIVSSGLLFVAIVSFVIAAFGIAFGNALFGLCGAKGFVLELVKKYMNIWFFGCVTSALSMEGNRLLISAGKPRLSSMMTFMGMVINVALDPLLIFGVGPLPRMGISGAALATVISQMISACVNIWLLWRMKLLEFRPIPLATLRLAIVTILRYAIPAVLGMLLFPISNFVTTKATATFNNETVAGVAAASRLEMVAFIIPMSIGIPLMSIIAQNYAARLYSRVRQSLYFACCIALFFLSITGALFFWLSPVFAPWFNEVPEVQQIMVKYMHIVPFGFAALEISRFGGFVVTGCDHPNLDMTLKIIRMAGLLIPLTLLAAHLHSLNGLFLARMVSDLLSGLLAFGFAYFIVNKRLPAKDGTPMEN